MVSLQNAPSVHLRWCASTQVDFSPQLGWYSHGPLRRGVSFLVKAEQVSVSNSSFSQDSKTRDWNSVVRRRLVFVNYKNLSATVWRMWLCEMLLGTLRYREGNLNHHSWILHDYIDGTSRRQLLAMGAALAPCFLLSDQNYESFAAENKKGFQAVLDQKDQYQFIYPFGWQEVVIEGQDKVFKDVIEPLESVSVNLIATNKQDVRDLGPPKDVAEALIKKVLAPPSQKTMLVEATEHDVDGTAYYTFEFIAKAPNYTRHALSTICIANGKFYTLTTGANERRWEKMKDKLHTVVDSFKIGTL